MLMPVSPKKLNHGFTLVEIIITISILTVALLATLQSWGNIAKRSGDVMLQSKVAYLGQAYIEEIMSRRFDELTPNGGGPCAPCTAQGAFGAEPGEARIGGFDDVDDYNGLNETGNNLFAGSAVVNAGQSYLNYSVTVTVTYVSVGVGSKAISAANQQLKRISVTITPPPTSGNPPAVFTAIKGSY